MYLITYICKTQTVREYNWFVEIKKRSPNNKKNGRIIK